MCCHFLFLKSFSLFIYLVLAALGLQCFTAFSSCGEQGPLSRGGAPAFHCTGFFYLFGAWAVRGMGSVVLVHRLNCPWGMWILPGPGIEPMSVALEGKFLTSRPPGKSLCHFL